MIFALHEANSLDFALDEMHDLNSLNFALDGYSHRDLCNKPS